MAKKEKKDYKITKRSDGRYQVVKRGCAGRINGLEKTKILLAAGLIKTKLPVEKPAATPAETVVNVIQGPFALPSEVNGAVPKDLDAVVERALHRDISQRQQSAAAYAAELRSVAAILDVRVGDTVQSATLLPIDDTPDRNAAGLLVGALAAAAAAAAAVWWWLSR